MTKSKKNGARARRIWVPVELMIMITGGHEANSELIRSGICIWCKASGWLDGEFGWAFNRERARTKLAKTHLMHKGVCPMNRFAIQRSLIDG